MRLISIKDVPLNLKIKLVRELGYDTDGTFILDKEGKKVLDKYTQEPIKLENMAIFPGSSIILDNNLLSIVSFLEEHGDAL